MVYEIACCHVQLSQLHFPAWVRSVLD